MISRKKHNKIFFPCGMIALSFLLLFFSLYISSFVQSNQKYIVKFKVINEYFLNKGYYGFEKRDLISSFYLKSNKDLIDIKNSLHSLTINKDTMDFVKIKLTTNINYPDVVRIIDLLMISKLEYGFLLKNNEFIVWYEDPRNPSLFSDRQVAYGGCIVETEEVPEIDFKLLLADWKFLMIVFLLLLMSVINFYKLKSIIIARS